MQEKARHECRGVGEEPGAAAAPRVGPSVRQGQLGKKARKKCTKMLPLVNRNWL